jgi:hypothetical protein
MNRSFIEKDEISNFLARNSRSLRHQSCKSRNPKNGSAHTQA